MFISSGSLITIALLIIGILWCRAIIKRFPKDLAEFKKPEDSSVRPVIIFYWVITFCFVLYIILIVWSIIHRFLNPMG